MGKQSLGRGLNAILRDHHMPEIEGPNGQKVEASIIKVDLDQIEPNPFQPRTVFVDSELTELANSIQEHGILQPITLRKHHGKFQIVAGERRFRAVQKLGWTSIEARVHDMVSDKSMAELALIENIQRQDLNSVEESKAYQALVENHGYTHEDLAKRLGKSRSAVTNSLRLLRLPDSVLGWISEGKLSAGHARSLLSPDISDPERAALDIMEKGLNVRASESLVREKKKPSSKSKASPVGLDPNLAQLIKEIQYALATKVKVLSKSTGGILQIEYGNLEDLHRIHGSIVR